MPKGFGQQIVGHSKGCSECQEMKPLSSFARHTKTKTGLRSQCRACVAGGAQLTAQRHPRDRSKACRRSPSRRLRPITPEAYDRLMTDQGGACAICLRVQRLFIDHDHKTGQNRGLLCQRCNSGLGLFGDNLEGFQRAFAYLKRYEII
jgi:hypothetical protein